MHGKGAGVCGRIRREVTEDLSRGVFKLAVHSSNFMKSITSVNNAARSKPDAARFFDNFAEAFDTIYDGKRNRAMRWIDQHFRSDMFLRFALTFEAFGDLKGKTVLDIGCGSGPYIVEALRRSASSVTGVDPAPQMLALVRQRLTDSGLANRCSLVQGLFPGIQLKPHDHVIIMGVLDYVADAKEFLTRLAPLVKVSAVISFPSKH